jgi:hypothetical protein
VLVSHWPGFYFGGEEVGFQVLKTVKRRLDAYDPDRSKTRWMKTSAIGHYWMARTLSDITTTAGENGQWQVRIHTRYPTADFTLAVDRIATQVQVNGQPLHPVYNRQALQTGTFLVEGSRTVVAFGLGEGETVLDFVS